MKDGSILANAGHFNVEISVDALKSNSKLVKQINENTTEYELKKGNKVYLIGEGRLVNLVAAEGHPSEVMDIKLKSNSCFRLLAIQSEGSLSPLYMKLKDHRIKKLQKQN